MTAPNKKDFLVYLKAYSDCDHNKAVSYYAPDVDFLLPDGQNFHSSEEVYNNLKKVHSVFDETLVPKSLLIEGNETFLIIDANFGARKAHKKGINGRDFEAGDVLQIEVWVHYDWEGGKIKKIICVQKAERWIGREKTLEQVNKESEATAPAELLDMFLKS